MIGRGKGSKGFGVTICSGCDNTIQNQTSYYQVVKRSKSFYKSRRYETLDSYCYECAKEKGLVE